MARSEPRQLPASDRSPPASREVSGPEAHARVEPTRRSCTPWRRRSARQGSLHSGDRAAHGVRGPARREMVSTPLQDPQQPSCLDLRVPPESTCLQPWRLPPPIKPSQTLRCSAGSQDRPEVVHPGAPPLPALRRTGSGTAPGCGQAPATASVTPRHALVQPRRSAGTNEHATRDACINATAEVESVLPAPPAEGTGPGPPTPQRARSRQAGSRSPPASPCLHVQSVLAASPSRAQSSGWLGPPCPQRTTCHRQTSSLELASTIASKAPHLPTNLALTASPRGEGALGQALTPYRTGDRARW